MGTTATCSPIITLQKKHNKKTVVQNEAGHESGHGSAALTTNSDMIDECIQMHWERGRVARGKVR